MALIHQGATLRPTKLEFLAEWLPTRDWYTGPAGEVTRVAGYRFDDPADAVGIETLLVSVGDGVLWQVPLTYREVPLDDAEDRLLTTAEHSVLGKRWVYDAVGDPVYAAALASAILGDTGQAEEIIAVDGRSRTRALTMDIASTVAAGAPVPPVTAVHRVTDGVATLIATDTVDLTVLRRLDTGSVTDAAALTGTWAGQDTPTPLATATRR